MVGGATTRRTIRVCWRPALRGEFEADRAVGTQLSRTVMQGRPIPGVERLV